MELTVVIPTHGGAARLPETLAALARGAGAGPAVEIVVVDDGSPQPIAAEAVAAASRPVPARVLRQEPNRGRAAACNRGVADARGRSVLILDDDMTLDDAALRGHLAAHPAGAVAHAIVGRIAPDPRCFTGRFGRFLALEEERRRQRLLAGADNVGFADCLTGHFSIPTATLIAAGGYADRFSRYGFEDIELAWRLVQRGVPILYRDDLVATHRSAHVGFATHCRRHLDSGAMAVLFAAAHDDPAVRRLLRVDGTTAGPGASAFLRVLAAAHGAVRAGPAALRPAILAAARGAAGVGEVFLPDRALHAVYHVVRDMHYAGGIAGAERST